MRKAVIFHAPVASPIFPILHFTPTSKLSTTARHNTPKPTLPKMRTRMILKRIKKKRLKNHRMPKLLTF